MRFLKQAGVVDGDGDLVSHALQNGNVVGVERFRLGGLHVQRAQKRVADNERQAHFGAGVGQERVFEVHGVGAHVEGDARFAVGGDVADDGLRSHVQVVAAFLELAANFAGGLAHDRRLALLVEQKD